MATTKQRSAAPRNIKKAAAAAQRKRTIAHLPKSTRSARGKEAAKAARRAQCKSGLVGANRIAPARRQTSHNSRTPDTHGRA